MSGLSVEVTPLSPNQEKASALYKLATARKNENDLDGAIEFLREAKAVLGSEFANVTVAQWCRLPLYLQQAGRIVESMAEFDLILNALPKYAEMSVSKMPHEEDYEFDGRLSSIRASYEAAIREKQVLALKRELKRFGISLK